MEAIRRKKTAVVVYLVIAAAYACRMISLGFEAPTISSFIRASNV